MKLDQVQLEQHKAGLQSFIDMNKAAVDFSSKAIQGVFLLNGGAATAILASKGSSLAGYACSFGVGAFLAVCAMGMAYYTNLAVSDTWQQYLIHTTQDQHEKYYKSYRKRLRLTVGIGALSGVWFISTLIFLWASI